MKKMRILIPNATSPKNLGDQAMLIVLIEKLKELYPNCELVIHSSDPEIQKQKLKYKMVRNTIASWISFPDLRFISRFSKLFTVIRSYIRVRRGQLLLRNKDAEIYKILTDYQEADLIVFVGGGSLRSQPGITQTVFLFLQLLQVMYAKLSDAPVIVMPISFGGFAYQWQEKVSAWALKSISKLYIREDISLQLTKQLGLQNAQFAYDIAFMTKNRAKGKNRRSKNLLIGLTLRQWFSSDKQRAFEQEIVEGLYRFSKYKSVEILPIVQVNAIEYGDFDKEVITRVAQGLKKRGVTVHEMIMLNSVDHACDTYAKIDVLIGMRMHANIIASTQGTPFISIGYEHKTKGIAKSIGMSDFSIDAQDVTAQILYNKLERLSLSKDAIAQKLTKKISHIAKKEHVRWGKVFSKYRGNPSITIGIPAFNAEKNIKPLLKSILSQKSRNYHFNQLIVFSDGSIDRTVDNAHAIKDERLHIIDSSKNNGFAHAVQKILSHSQSDVTIIFNDDIELMNEHILEKIATAFVDPNIGLVSAEIKPFKPTTFIERASLSSFDAYSRIKVLPNNGNNKFTCDGKILAVRKTLAEKVNLENQSVGNVDIYLFYACRKFSYVYKFIKNPLVYFRLPQSIDDLKNQTKRAQLSRNIMKNKLINFQNNEKSLPFTLLIVSIFYEVMKNPLGSIALFVINKYAIRYSSQDIHFKTWKLATSTKNLS